MLTPIKRWGAGVFILIWAALPVLQARQPPANAHAVALVHFQERLKAYAALRDKLKASTPPKTTPSSGELVGRQETLAAEIRRARSDAKEGDLFIPEVAPIIRHAVADDLRRRTPKERAAAFQEVPAGLGLEVNDLYPKSVPLATVPPKLLAALPQLPEGLEYRFVGHRLILHDTVANLVVDILEDAVPRR